MRRIRQTSDVRLDQRPGITGGKEGEVPVAKYEEIASTLTEEIESGRWPAGTLLPTFPELEARFGASRITVRGALDKLVTQGIVYSGYINGKRGTVVRQTGRTEHYATDALHPGRPKSPNDAFVENSHRVGRTPSKKFRMQIGPVPEHIAARLGVDPDDLVVIRTTVQLLDNEPWARETSYYPRPLAEAAGLDTPHDIDQGTIRALAAAGFKEVAYRDEVTDEAASASEVDDLAVPLGAPLLVQTRTAATEDRITRVTVFHRLGRRNRLIWELGDDNALGVIRSTRTQEPGTD